MKRIVLKSLPPQIDRLIDERAKAEGVGRKEAVIEILRDIDIERAVEHDMAILRESWKDEEDRPTASYCCCHEHRCGRSDTLTP